VIPASPRAALLIRRIVAGVAVLFGLATLVAGLRVLLGRSDPGYLVFGPLLAFNTGMGVAYVAVGAAAWRSLRWGRNGAGAVFLLNLAAWLTVLVLGAAGAGVATESLRAMGFRTGVWLALLLTLAWLHRRSGSVSGT
jgi:hypothetical protein